MNKRMYLYFFIFMLILISYLLFWQGHKVEKNIKEQKKTMQNSNSIEISEIAKNDKDFYDISMEKDMRGISKNNHKKHRRFQRVKMLFTTENADILEMDKEMTALLMDKKIARIDKITGLWSILNEIGFSSQKSEYLIDALGTLMPVELTSELIYVYKEQSSSHAMKIKMIEMLSNNLFIANPNVQDKKRLQFIVDKKEEIQTFIKEKVLNDANSEITSEGLRAYASMSGREEVEELMTNLSESKENTHINSDVIRKIMTETALSTSTAQEEMLPAMLNEMENNPNIENKEKEAFTQMMIESLNAGVMTEESSKELDTYLKNNEPVLQINDDKSAIVISNYYHWAEAVSKIKDSDTSLVDMALNNDNSLKVSSLLLYADRQTIQRIKQSSNVEDMHAMLELALVDESTSSENKTIIKDAIGVLSEDIQDMPSNKLDK